jgi:NAD(P)-dependent dehydrogenase (short-subunit alcohol dehydrogenase family)
MGKLNGKVAIVTGATLGLGRAMSLRFAREGAKVVMAARNEAMGNQLGREIADAGGTSMFVKTDVVNPEDIRRMVQAGVERFGRLDILVNNAGMQPETHAPTADVTLEDWDHVIKVNLTSVFLGCKYAIPEILKSGGGAIINVASAGGLVGFLYSAAYCASKAGVINLTKATALEYAAQGISVNAICPGVVWTPMVEKLCSSDEMREMLLATTPSRKFGQPEEVAALALLLASGEVPFCVGAPFIIDGGMVAQ